MSVVVEKPYTFVPPHRGNLWPAFIQRLRLVDFYLKRKDGVVSYECRHLERLRESYANDYGVLLAPNHCRYADPLVLGWLSRESGRHVFAMASWHLFNKSWFDRFSIPKMGGFSIWREGVDRQSLETAIEVLVQAKRPLIIFPEGTTNRTNDRVQPLLDGVPFIARTAAKRRVKAGHGPVVVHPVGIKYLFQGNILEWADGALTELETHLSWRRRKDGVLSRIERVAEGLLSLKEVEYFGQSQSGDIWERSNRLMMQLLERAESELSVDSNDEDPILHRVRNCRTQLVTQLLDPQTSESRKEDLRDLAVQVELVQQLVSYPRDYLIGDDVSDTRILETLERMQEDFFGKSRSPSPLHVVIDVDEAIRVDESRPKRGQRDPLLTQLKERLETKVRELGREASRISVSN